MYEKFASIGPDRDTSLAAAAYRSGVTMEGRLMSTLKMPEQSAIACSGGAPARLRPSLWVAIFLVVVAGLAMGRVTAQSGHDLFQKALAAERADGDMQRAIQLYERIAKEFAADRALSAKALLRLGDCYQKVGEAKAQAVFEQVARQFADQTDAAAEARTRLAALTRTSAGSAGIVTRQVWKDKDVDTTGTISADGRYLSFTDWSTGDLAVRDLATSSNRRLTNKGTWAQSEDFAEYSVMRHNGHQVAYAWYDDKTDRFDLRIVETRPDRPAPRILYSNEDVEYLRPADWSPDGQWIAVELERRDRTMQMGLVSASDGSLRVLKSIGWRRPGELVFSPDGRYVAFDSPHSESSQQRDVFVMAIDGSREVSVVVDPADDSVLSWMPDGKLLFISDRAGSTDLWGIPFESGRPRGAAMLIKSDVGRPKAMGTTRTGALYFGVLPARLNLYTASVDFKEGKVVMGPATLPGSLVGRHPEWSPDGRYLAYQVLARNRARPTLAIRSEATGDVRELRPDLAYFNQPRWAPDGRSLMVDGRDPRGRRGAYRVDAQTGAVTPLVQLSKELEAIWSPLPLPDGLRIVFLRIDSARKEIVIVERDLGSGREREVMRRKEIIGQRFMSLSPDGRHLALTAADRASNTSRLVVVPLESGPPRELLQVPLPQELGWTSWSPDGGAVLFTKTFVPGTDDGSEVWIISSAGGQPKKLDFGLDRIRGLGVRPHTNQVVFFRLTDTPVELWVMENLAAQSNGRR